MGPKKVVAQKAPGQKHLYSRVSFLYQAATYLAEASSEGQTTVFKSNACKVSSGYSKADPAILTITNDHGPSFLPREKDVLTDKGSNDIVEQSNPALTNRLLGHLRAVSLKGQVRLSATVKHNICKRCDALLVPGVSATAKMENKSRDGRKPWADVFVINCHNCGTAKRFPIGSKRQSTRKERQPRSMAKQVVEPEATLRCPDVNTYCPRL